MFAQKHQLIFLFLFFGILMAASLQGQNDCYVQLDEASGFDVSLYQAELDAKACELVAAFPDSSYADSFKVYSFGFYVNLDYYDGYSYPQAFQDLQEKVAALSPYYLLIGRQSDRNGVFTKFWVDVKLPETGSFNTDCLNETARILLTSSIGVDINQKHSQLGQDPFRYYEAELVGIDSLITFIEKIIECCDPEMRASCDLCSNSSTIMDYFLELGFDTYQYKVIGPSPTPLTGEQNKVEDFANLLVEIDGDTVNLAEVFLEGISSTFLDSLSVKGLFTKDGSFCDSDEDFLAANQIWENPNYDFIQWVHYSKILAPDGSSYILVAIKEDLLNAVTELPAIDVYLVPPDPKISNLFELDKIRSVVQGIYLKNHIKINILMIDKENLDLHDLWITVISESNFDYGNTDVQYPEPISIKPSAGDIANSCWINFARFKCPSCSNEFINYRMGYVASHELLHQLLIKAYYFLWKATQIPGMYDLYTNPFTKWPIHYTHTRNLLDWGDNSWRELPNKWTNESVEAEKIIPKHFILIHRYLVWRYFENSLPDEVKKKLFPIWRKDYKTYLDENKYDFFSK